MKAASLLIIASFLLGFASCKKDEIKKPAGYAQLSLADIKAEEAQLSGNKITVSNANGLLWKTGDVFIFKAHGGHFGKFRVVSVDKANNYGLTIAATVYKADGSIAKQVESLLVKGTWSCDLEMLKETLDAAAIDFQWDRSTETDTNLQPANGARFRKYVF